MHGRILTLGRQDVFVTHAELLKLMQEFGRGPLRQAAQVLSRKEQEAREGLISDQFLFDALGFSECLSMDASNYESADIIFDLNKPNTPADLASQWEVVLDGGTMEHVFHVPNFLANIFRLLKVGGRVIHMAPSSNHIDHGFYMFSPTLFWDYYTANNFEINVCQVFRYTTNLYDGLWEVSDYVPGALTPVSLGGLDDALYGVILIATKRERSTCDVIPQQGVYKDGRWQSKPSNAEEATAPNADETASPQAQIAARYASPWERIKRRLLGPVPSPPPKGLGLKIRYRL